MDNTSLFPLLDLIQYNNTPAQEGRILNILEEKLLYTKPNGNLNFFLGHSFKKHIVDYDFSKYFQQLNIDQTSCKCLILHNSLFKFARTIVV